MPAFTFARMQQITEGLRMMYHRSVAYKPFFLTYKQVKKLWLNPEHYEILEKARELFKVGGDSAFSFSLPTIAGAGFNADSSYNSEESFPFPNYMGEKIFLEEGKEDPVLKKLQEWCEWRARIARDFTIAIAVLEEFNASCSSPRVINYLWPSLVPIMRMRSDESLRKLALKLSESRTTPGDVPGFKPSFKVAANEAAGVVARTQMLTAEHDNKAAPKGKVQITLESFTMRCPWNDSQELRHRSPMQPEAL